MGTIQKRERKNGSTGYLAQIILKRRAKSPTKSLRSSTGSKRRGLGWLAARPSYANPAPRSGILAARTIRRSPQSSTATSPVEPTARPHRGADVAHHKDARRRRHARRRNHKRTPSRLRSRTDMRAADGSPLSREPWRHLRHCSRGLELPS